MKSLENFAVENGLDIASLKDMKGFIENAVKENPVQIQKIIEVGRWGEFVKEGVVQWRNSRIALAKELLENKTPRAKEQRKMIAEQVFKICNQGG